MRKIISKQERDKKTRRNQLIIGGILILIMVFSTVGYALSGRGDETNADKTEYNGIEFVRDNSGYWYFEIQDQQFIIINNPKNISEINFLNTLSINDYSNKPLYFVGDIGEGSSEIARNLADRFVLRIQQACLDEEDCEGNFPIKNCSIDNIIIFNEISDNETENNKKEIMYQEENCIFIFSEYENQSKYADKFLFKLLGI